MKALLRPLAKLVAGNGLAQALSLLALPAISRLYSPAEFGLFASVLVPVGLVAILASMQFQHALVLPKVESHARGLFRLGCVGAIVMGVGASLATLIFLRWFPIDEGDSWLYGILSGAAVASTTLAQLTQGLAVRTGAFGLVGMAAVLRASTTIALQASLGFMGSGPKGLLFGYVLGEAVGTITLWIKQRPSVVERPTRRRALWHLALSRRYGDFVTHGSAQELLNSASQGLPVLLLTHYFGAAVSGAYAFAMRLLMAPVQLIANAVRQVLYRELALQTGDTKQQFAFFWRVTLLLGLPATIAAALIAPFLPRLFALAFGESWLLAGRYAAWLTFWAVLLLCNAPATLVFRTLRKQGVSLRFNGVLLLLRVSILIVGGTLFSANLTIAAFSMINVAMNILYIAIAYRLLLSQTGGTRT
jgi:O-antigen/teichoic acid export membrane protein